MTEEHKKYEKTIKKKHSFGWTPKYEEETKTSLSKIVFAPIVIKTFEKLEWDIVFQDETQIEAKRKGDWNRWTEKISVSFEFGKIKVKSVSLGNEMWDNGTNSKRVKLFIHVFNEIEKSFDRKTLKELETETEKANNWDDYEIPETLPKPKKREEPKIIIPIIGGIITALLLGFLLAQISIKGIYIIGLFEVGVALAIGFIFKHLIKLSNFTNYNKLNYILIGTVIITYISNQYFQYQLILNANNYEPIGFIEFIKLRLESGLIIKKLNTGWIGLIISWILQLVITFFIGTLRLAVNLTNYQLERVPIEVVDFAVYHFIKEKTESQVRTELSKKGWIEKQYQDEVIEAIGAIQDVTELNRME